MPYKNATNFGLKLSNGTFLLRSFLTNLNEVVKAGTHEGFCFRNMLHAHLALPVHTRGHTAGASSCYGTHVGANERNVVWDS